MRSMYHLTIVIFHPRGDLMSREYSGRSNSSSSIIYTFQTTRVTGDDDDQKNVPDPDEGEAEINGPNYEVKSFSDNGSVYSTHISVLSTATINFRLQLRRPFHFSELVVKAHLQGSLPAGWKRAGRPEIPTYIFRPAISPAASGIVG